MTTLSEIICRRPTPKARDRREGKIQRLSEPIQVNSEKAHAKYEAEVFNFLLANRDELGIRCVNTFKALMLDGAVELVDGQRFAVEIKFRMNWLKACQAECQFRNFLKRHVATVGHVDGGIVIFEEFSGDWRRPDPSDCMQAGWSHWYRAHSEVDGIHVSLLQFRNQKLETFFDAVTSSIGR